LIVINRKQLFDTYPLRKAASAADYKLK